MTPSKYFFVTGVGTHKHELASFEQALRNAGIEKLNIVTVSSILPPDAIPENPSDALATLTPGRITFMVISRISTNEPGRLIAASCGIAKPLNSRHHGYISEFHAFGMEGYEAAERAEDLAAWMLATTLGLDFDVDKNWNEQKQQFEFGDKAIFTNSIVAYAKGDPNGLFTTAISAVVLLP